MARFDSKVKVEVTLSATDRQLLRDIRDALRAAGPKPADEAVDGVRRLVEAGMRTSTPEGEWDYTLLDDHIVADTKGYTWNGSGWAPKE